MKTKDKKLVQEKILAEIERVKVEIEQMEEIASAESFDGLEEVERMEAVIAKSANDTALATARSRVARLEYTIKRMKEDQDFGVCLECGESIPLPRLLAMPETTHCVKCAE